ncbi:Cof-type HAD-IIB family hydrolase [uncultured Cedecea sp.]|uniref:Cof-type HAD-IIB family hydrolase n=1 Tax=uncultured Cedecea sp. TaxID=988762 RepID=UPI0026030DE4|nr:Cof-type HAD-IIB family hydrolase [uncultured Cedecea sp.]
MKLLAIDMDGTLLNSAGQISEENRQSLADFIDHTGGEVIVCSARPLVTLLKLLEEQQVLSLVRYVAGFNGSQVFDTKEDVILFEGLMNSMDMRDINSAVGLYKYPHHFFTATELIYPAHKPLSSFTEYEAKVFGLPLQQSTQAEIYQASDICKITVCGDKESILKYQQTLAEDMPAGFSSMATGENYIDIQPTGIDKGHAVAFIKQRLNLVEQDIIAIGDQHNDLPMFNIAGIKIAMGNAVERLKKAATFVTSDNNQHGVAVAVNWAISRA